MIAVTGAPRTGTSMIMQTIKLFGLNIVGDKYLDEFGPRSMNPKGYWCLPVNKLLRGIPDNRYEGKAIKLLGNFALMCNQSLISKAIVCIRSFDDSVASFKRMMTAMGSERSMGMTAHQIVGACLASSNEFIKQFNGPLFIADYDLFRADPELNVLRLARFLGVDNKNIDKAVDNIERRELCLFG